MIGELEEILNDICDYAAEHNLIENNSVVYRDLFDTKSDGSFNRPPIKCNPPFSGGL